MPTSTEEYEKRIRFEFPHAQIVELDGKPIGLFKASYTEELNYWYLVQIQISPEFQGLKIGSKLILDLRGIHNARHFCFYFKFSVFGTML